MRRWVVPGEVVTGLSVSLSEAFEGLAAAAKSLGDENASMTLAALTHVHYKLDRMHEILLAVVEEQNGS